MGLRANVLTIAEKSLLECYAAASSHMNNTLARADVNEASMFLSEPPTGPCRSVAIAMLLLIAAKQQQGSTAVSYMRNRANAFMNTAGIACPERVLFTRLALNLVSFAQLTPVVLALKFALATPGMAELPTISGELTRLAAGLHAVEQSGEKLEHAPHQDRPFSSGRLCHTSHTSDDTLRSLWKGADGTK